MTSRPPQMQEMRRATVVVEQFQARTSVRVYPLILIICAISKFDFKYMILSD